MRTVWVVNFAGHVLTAAKKHGEIKYLTEGKIPIFSTDRLIDELKIKLKFFQDDDYLLLSGNNIINMLVFAILIQNRPALDILIYNFKSKDYVLRHIERSQLNGHERVSESQGQTKPEKETDSNKKE